MRRHEAHFPAEQPSARPHAWVPHPHEHPGGSCRARRASRQGSHSYLGLAAEPFVLPGRRRIRRAEDFRVVMRAGSRAASRTVVVHAHSSPTSAPARAGFVVGRSVGGSVVRNRVTRRLRHLMAAHLEYLPAGTDWSSARCPRRPVRPLAELDHDLSSSVRRVMSRLGHDAGTPRGCPRDTGPGIRIRSTSRVGHDPRTAAVRHTRGRDSWLSAVHLAALRTHMSLLPLMFGLCSGGGTHPRAGQGVPPLRRTAGALQPLVPRWDRSCAGQGQLAGW